MRPLFSVLRAVAMVAAFGVLGQVALAPALSASEVPAGRDSVPTLSPGLVSSPAFSSVSASASSSASSPASSPAIPRQDTGGTKADSADSTASLDALPTLRGTKRPLQRRSSVLRTTGRALLLPPYAVVAAAAFPVEQAMLLYEKNRLFHTVVDLFAGKLHFGRIGVESFVNFQSGESFAEVGLKGTLHDWLDEDGKISLKAGFLNADRNIADLKLQTPPRRVQLSLRGLLDNKPGRKFHGLGASSREKDAEANRRRYLVEAEADLGLGHGLGLRLSGYDRRMELSRTEEDGEIDFVGDVFPKLFAQAEESEYLGTEAALSYDHRDNAENSSTGLLLEVVAGHNESRSAGDGDYQHYGAEIQGFVPLGRRNRVLALRAFAHGIEADNDSSIPYGELERPGGRMGLRGYPKDRFADFRQLVLTAEYRYPVTKWIQGQVFIDWGSVGSTWDRVQLSAIDPSFGFGLNVGRQSRVSLQLAGSSEGVQFSLGSNTLFTRESRRVQ